MPVTSTWSIPKSKVMFGNLVQRLQTLSPLTSPVTSPVGSPKSTRKRYSKSPAHRRSLKEEYREVQSEPEDTGETKKCRAKRKADKRKVNISGPLQGSKSMGRLDGLKQVSVYFFVTDIRICSKK